MLLLNRIEKYTILVLLLSYSVFQTCVGVDTLDTLGFGFSGYDGTFENNHLRSRVLDLGALKTINGFQIRERVDPLFFDNLNREYHVEDGFDEFATSLKTSISVGGGFAGFKANIGAHYNVDTTRRNEYYFSRRATVIERAHLRIDTPNTDLLRKLVIPRVASYLSSAEPFSIFATYGTHVTTRVIAGGMLELWSSSLKSKFTSKSDFSASISASYLSFVKGSSSLSIEQRRNALRVQSREGLVIRGGELHVGSNGEENWVSSTKTNSETVKFLPGGAIPIWELIEDASQARKVKDYYELVFGGSSLILKRFASTPVDIAHRAPHPEAQVYVERGWKVISGGADVRFYGSGQLLTKSYPIISGGVPVGWKVASKDHIESDPGRIQAIAIAMWDPFNVFDVIVSSSSSGTAPHPSAKASIPAGYKLVGGGADVRYKAHGNMLVANYPISGTSWYASSKDHIRSAPSSLTVYAIGMKHRNGGLIRSRKIDARFGPQAHPQGDLHATKGYGFVGGGAFVSKGGSGNMLVKIVPSVDGSRIHAYAKDHLRSDPQRLTIVGIEVYGATFVQKTSSVASLDPNAL